jgi:acetyltransferase-like isoleucine patch superfamily enzyme
MIAKLKSWLRYKLNKEVYPEMIGYPIWNGEKKRNLRISNLTRVSAPKNVRVGDNVFIGHFNTIDGHCFVVIGEGVQITNYVSIATHSSHDSIRVLGEDYETYFERSPSLVKGDVQIGDYSYVGPHSVLMPGVTIGKGCVISAYSYVDKDVPDYSIVRGIPAEIVGDTRSRDATYLEKNPSEKHLYFDSIKH